MKSFTKKVRAAADGVRAEAMLLFRIGTTVCAAVMCAFYIIAERLIEQDALWGVRYYAPAAEYILMSELAVICGALLFDYTIRQNEQRK